METGSYRFTVRYLRAVYVLAWGIFTPIFVSRALDPGKGGVALTLLALICAAGFLVCTIRGARAATVEADHEGVEYRSLLRTRRWKWQQLERFEAHDSLEGAMQYRRRVLFAYDVDGRVRKLQEINARSTRSPNPIDEVAERLNQLTRP